MMVHVLDLAVGWGGNKKSVQNFVHETSLNARLKENMVVDLVRGCEVDGTGSI